MYLMCISQRLHNAASILIITKLTQTDSNKGRVQAIVNVWYNSPAVNNKVILRLQNVFCCSSLNILYNASEMSSQP